MKAGERYRHYKGKFYKILAISEVEEFDSEILEDDYLFCHAQMEKDLRDVMVFHLPEELGGGFAMIFTNQETDEVLLDETMVIYENEETGNKWVCNIKDFDDIVNNDVGTKRFTLVD